MVPVGIQTRAQARRALERAQREEEEDNQGPTADGVSQEPTSDTSPGAAALPLSFGQFTISQDMDQRARANPLFEDYSDVLSAIGHNQAPNTENTPADLTDESTEETGLRSPPPVADEDGYLQALQGRQEQLAGELEAAVTQLKENEAGWEEAAMQHGMNSREAQRKLVLLRGQRGYVDVLTEDLTNLRQRLEKRTRPMETLAGQHAEDQEAQATNGTGMREACTFGATAAAHRQSSGAIPRVSMVPSARQVERPAAPAQPLPSSARPDHGMNARAAGLGAVPKQPATMKRSSIMPAPVTRSVVLDEATRRQTETTNATDADVASVVERAAQLLLAQREAVQESCRQRVASSASMKRDSKSEKKKRVSTHSSEKKQRRRRSRSSSSSSCMSSSSEESSEDDTRRVQGARSFKPDDLTRRRCKALRPFKGESDEDLDAWIRSFKRATVTLPDEYRQFEFDHLMEGAALKWKANVDRECDRGRKEKPSMKEWIRMLKERFEPTQSERVKTMKSLRKRPSDTIRSYFDKKEQLFSQVAHKYDDDIVELFTHGLSAEYKSQLPLIKSTISRMDAQGEGRLQKVRAMRVILEEAEAVMDQTQHVYAIDGTTFDARRETQNQTQAFAQLQQPPPNPVPDPYEALLQELQARMRRQPYDQWEQGRGQPRRPRDFKCYGCGQRGHARRFCPDEQEQSRYQPRAPGMAGGRRDEQAPTEYVSDPRLLQQVATQIGQHMREQRTPAAAAAGNAHPSQ